MDTLTTQLIERSKPAPPDSIEIKRRRAESILRCYLSSYAAHADRPFRDFFRDLAGATDHPSANNPNHGHQDTIDHIRTMIDASTHRPTIGLPPQRLADMPAQQINLRPAWFATPTWRSLKRRLHRPRAAIFQILSPR